MGEFSICLAGTDFYGYTTKKCVEFSEKAQYYNGFYYQHMKMFTLGGLQYDSRCTTSGESLNIC